MSNEMSELDISISNGMSEVEPKPKTKSKEITMSKIINEAEANDIRSELEVIEEVVMTLEEDFGDLGLEEAEDKDISSTELEKLNSAIEGTDFEVPPAEEVLFVAPTILDLADEQDMQEGWTDWINPARIIKNKARKIIKRIVRLVEKYRKLAVCAPAVTKAVLFYKTGKYGSALRAGWSAYKCIKNRR